MHFDFLSELVKLPVAWEKVVAFHLDEYVGLPTSHPASFRKYLKDRLFDVVKPPMKEVNLLDADNDKALEEYATKLAAGDIDFACIGIGENGHIAFNVREATLFVGVVLDLFPSLTDPPPLLRVHLSGPSCG